MRIIQCGKKKGLDYKGHHYKVNPFAVCNTTAPKDEGEERHERCVKEVKKKSKTSSFNSESKKSGINIKPSHKGKFTEYCGGKVTEECIQRGLKSKDPDIVKEANFARNARKWSHAQINADELKEVGQWREIPGYDGKRIEKYTPNRHFRFLISKHGNLIQWESYVKNFEDWSGQQPYSIVTSGQSESVKQAAQEAEKSIQGVKPNIPFTGLGSTPNYTK